MQPLSIEVSPRPSLLDWLRLLRLPNVFTAMADVMLGFLLTHANLEPAGVFAALLLASSLLYLSGMVLNDVFDIEIDRIERQGRPLPSGRIALHTAKRLGYGLLIVGTGVGWLATILSGDVRCGMTATLLAFSVFLYDAMLKNTPAAPLAMGACRLLNVLLGMSAGGGPWHGMHWIVATGIGIYIAGLTWFGRGEAGISGRWQLVTGTAVMLLGLGVVAWYPSWYEATIDTISRPRLTDADAPGNPLDYQRWLVFWLLIGLLISRHCVHAILDPRPWRVQRAVKHSILSLIVIDAAAATAVRDFRLCLLILLLLLPAMLLGRWVYST